MTVERRGVEDRTEPGADRAKQHARVLEDPEIRARAEAAVEAFRRRELPLGEGVGPEQLPDFLREHG
ncbi:MAG: hypothetical protein ABI635_06145 [Actinomycetota bacterium]